ncbi:MAG: S8 family serine peptidase [Acidobacteriota bacterium]
MRTAPDEPVPALERPLWLNERLGDVTGRGVRIAVVDSGVTRKALATTVRLANGHGLVDDAIDDGLSLVWSDDSDDRIGHGTACCHVLATLVPGAEIVPLRVFGRRLETSPRVVVAALDWAIDHQIDLVNLSLGSTSEAAVEPFRDACARARAAGLVVVSAMPWGAPPTVPAVLADALGVTAGRVANAWDFTHHDDAETAPWGVRAEFTCSGSFRVPWREATGRKTEAVVFGSSLAAPHLTALVALLRERFPGADLATVRRLLVELARPHSILRGDSAQPRGRPRTT